MTDLNLNIDSKNIEQCLKEIWNFGGTTYQNICTGQSNYVQWGNMDWFVGIFVSVFIIAFTIIIISILFKIVFDN